MKPLILGLAIAMGLMLAQGAHAQPANQVTATCNDGTTFTGTSRSGACKGHQGVKAWTTASSTKTTQSPKTTGKQTAAASGGHAGEVWVNTSSKVYHCPGDKYYGKTTHGKYLTESAAKAAGYHASQGKACKS